MPATPSCLCCLSLVKVPLSLLDWSEALFQTPITLPEYAYLIHVYVALQIVSPVRAGAMLGLTPEAGATVLSCVIEAGTQMSGTTQDNQARGRGSRGAVGAETRLLIQPGSSGQASWRKWVIAGSSQRLILQMCKWKLRDRLMSVYAHTLRNCPKLLHGEASQGEGAPIFCAPPTPSQQV